MKKSFVFLITLLLSLQLMSQNSAREGKVIYNEVMKLNINLEGDAAQFANAMPKERKSKKELIFNDEASIYKNFKGGDEAEDVAMEHGGTMVQIKMTEPDNQFFADHAKKKTVEQKEFMTRVFLIEGNIDAAGWKITGEQKSILDYACQKAVKTDEEGNETIAWFTPQIPVSTGPLHYIGLPGLVLEVVLKNGDHTISAAEIALEPVLKDDLQKPKKGKKVTQEEFDEIVAEKMKEMGAQQGGQHGTFIMRIEK